MMTSEQIDKCAKAILREIWGGCDTGPYDTWDQLPERVRERLRQQAKACLEAATC
jgi:hypothetical protein